MIPRDLELAGHLEGLNYLLVERGFVTLDDNQFDNIESVCDTLFLGDELWRDRSVQYDERSGCDTPTLPRVDGEPIRVCAAWHLPS